MDGDRNNTLQAAHSMMPGMDMLGGPKKPNTLPIWGNSTTMNLNPLILTNIETSPYFIGRLAELKTYHELVDEIYYKVKHLEPWERGSRASGGRRQTGMCGGVRGVGVGGIISSAFCILYKLFTMRLTRKQVYGLLNHSDSPFIRGIGFLYVRFTQPPPDFWDWFEAYIEDTEEIDVRAGGGQIMTIGEMVRLFLTRLDWFTSLFPRIPVPIQIAIDKKLAALKHSTSTDPTPKKAPDEVEPERVVPTERRREERPKRRSRSRSPKRRSRSRERERERRSRRSRSKSRESHRHKKKDHRSRSKTPKKNRRSRSRSRSRYEKGSSSRQRYDHR
ncbi:unnamed protein product [Orchesella dallaii]|uniref:Pre-mRNA-splicing factor 38 n=1 Tax=Orchesella dallaii TaxID=48710 RepID=A0ABP1RDZ7_9HEXA